jgi:hypothetical protein
MKLLGINFDFQIPILLLRDWHANILFAKGGVVCLAHSSSSSCQQKTKNKIWPNDDNYHSSQHSHQNSNPSSMSVVADVFGSPKLPPAKNLVNNKKWHTVSDCFLLSSWMR